jgi:uncharacterized membrane protein
MTSVLEKLERAVIAGFILAAIIFWLLVRPAAFDHGYWTFFMRWLHVLNGVMWIGLLWYFNFVQIPSMPKIPDEQKPAVSKVIAPAALFWFRYAALGTVITGLLLAWMMGYIGQALMLGGAEGVPQHRNIGIGMWLGLIMAFNVWFLIWPNQQKALGLVEATPDEKKAAGRTAMLVSRANTVLSIPMLYAMVSAQNI